MSGPLRFFFEYFSRLDYGASDVDVTVISGTRVISNCS